MVDPNANRVDIGIPVLIVGAGPAGLTLALALTRDGVPALTIERHPGTAHTPRAHIINQRTVEISGLSSTTPETTTHQSGKAGLTANRPSVTVTRARDQERPVLILMAKWWSDHPGRRHGNVQPRPRRADLVRIPAGQLPPPRERTRWVRIGQRAVAGETMLAELS
jgi:choline dehydrogenase-like flavoprotein